jgi:Holliday junction resolvasome RuvABC DNA-binding subunit
MAEKTKQELVTELAKLQNAMYEARKFYHNKGTFIDLEEQTQKAFGSLMKLGMTPKDIKEEVEEMLRNSW